MFDPISDSHWPEELADLRGSFATGLNVYRAMAHHPALLKAWADYRMHIVEGSCLPKDLQEILILRTGYRHKSGYEWAHHVARASKVGVDEARIAACAGPPEEITAPEDRLLVKVVDELVDSSRLEPDTLSALTLLLGKEGVLDAIFTVGMYTSLAFLLNSFGTPVDDDIA